MKTCGNFCVCVCVWRKWTYERANSTTSTQNVDVFSEHINGTPETNIHHGKNEGSIVFPMLWSDHVKLMH